MDHFLRKIVLIIFCLTAHDSFGFDNPHFYKAPYFNATKSWNNKKWLSTFYVSYASGRTSRGENNDSTSSSAFDIYGNHNLLYLTKGVPQPSALSGTLLNYVNAIDTKRTNFENDHPTDNRTFGLANFCGKNSVDEIVFNIRQNIVYNFFLELNLPIRNISIDPLTLIDRSPSSVAPNTSYTQTDQDWLNFINNLDAILQTYGFSGYQCGTRTTGLGDASLVAGWQYAIGKVSNWFEYTKFAIKAGVLLPTGSERNYKKPFSIESGYNEHWGIPGRIDLILGLSKDIYFGSYMGLIFFSPKTFNGYPVKTTRTQNGFINLFKARVEEKNGTIFDIGGYLKLDHFFKGLSALVGYSYNRQANKSLSLVNSCEETNDPIINSDCRIKNWYQHVLHMMAEYDFSSCDMFKKKSWKPAVSIFYDHPFDGKRVFTNSMFGVSLTLEMTC